MLCVRDITSDLGVMNNTVWRWIREGKLKATIVNRRVGWKIKEEDYAKFLENHPRWQLVHDGEVYKQNEIQAREDALTEVLATVISVKGIVGQENRSNEYMKGFNRAINSVTLAISNEMRKKITDSRQKQTA